MRNLPTPVDVILDPISEYFQTPRDIRAGMFYEFSWPSPKPAAIGKPAKVRKRKAQRAARKATRRARK